MKLTVDELTYLSEHLRLLVVQVRRAPFSFQISALEGRVKAINGAYKSARGMHQVAA